MAYLSFNKPSDHFLNLLYTANGSTNAQTTGFAPALTWIKKRNAGSSHYLFDTTRSTYSVSSDDDAVQADQSGQGFTSLDSTGFTLSGTGGGGGVNDGTNTFSSWNFKGGSTSVPAGSDVTVSACNINTDAGFGVYKYTGNNTVGQVIKHGLGRTPQCLLIKNTATGTTDWAVYQARTDGDLTQAGDFFIRLNTDAARSNNDGYFNDTFTTATDITLGADAPVNGNGVDIIMYAFCNVPGYCRMGGYYGANRSHGPFVYCGFKPATIIVKATTTGGWYIYNSQTGYNGARPYLQANAISAEDTNEGNFGIDLNANGFKIHGSNAGIDPDGGQVCYMAWADEPLISNNGKSATAR
jgi:hypothetical protein